MHVYLLAIILIAVAVGGIAIKMFIKPGGTFTKTCGSATDPKTGKPMPCSCKSDEDRDCDYKNEDENIS